MRNGCSENGPMYYYICEFVRSYMEHLTQKKNEKWQSTFLWFNLAHSILNVIRISMLNSRRVHNVNARQYAVASVWQKALLCNGQAMLQTGEQTHV